MRTATVCVTDCAADAIDVPVWLRDGDEFSDSDDNGVDDCDVDVECDAIADRDLVGVEHRQHDVIVNSELHADADYDWERQLELLLDRHCKRYEL